MQNVQNAAEIQQRVINLVELYRTKVGKESESAQYLAKEYQRQYDQEINFAYDLHEQGFRGYILNIDISEDEIDKIRVNEQLLGHFYMIVAGEKVDKAVLSQFLPEEYDTSIFTEEEESFLRSHFKEMVNYIIQTPNNNLDVVDRKEYEDKYLIPSEVLELIKSRVSIPAGSKIYNPFTGFAQFPCLFQDCTFFCEESFIPYKRRWNSFCDDLEKRPSPRIVRNKIDEYRLYSRMRVALFANSIDATVIEDYAVPRNYDTVMSFIPWIPRSVEEEFDYVVEYTYDTETINKIQMSYQKLTNGGKMVLILPTDYCWAKPGSFPLESFWKQLVDDKSLVEVIHLPSVMSNNAHGGDYCIIIAEKGVKGGDTTFIDARFAFRESDNSIFSHVLDLNALYDIFQNEGKDGETGLRKIAYVPKESIHTTVLVPQVYVVEKPSESDHPVSLASLCSLSTSHIYDVEEDLTKDTPWVDSSNLSPLYVGSLKTETMRKAGLPNNPKGWKYGTQELSPFSVGAEGSGITERDVMISEYRNCRFLDGSKDAILFGFTGTGFCTALIYATGKPIAVDKDIHVLYPNNGINALSLLAILRLPVVYWQLQTYVSFGLYGPDGLLKDVMVPTDRRIIGDEILRMKREESVTKEFGDNYAVAQKKHKAKLEDYQHAMRKHIREISSSVRRMERFINDMDSSDEVKKFLYDRLAVIKRHRLYLSEDIERLNEENTYGEASPFDIDHCLRSYREYFGSDVCTIKYTNEIANEAIRQYLKDHQAELKELDEKSRYKNIEMASTGSSLAYVDIAEYNFGKIVRNILENAKKHGFDGFFDVNRKDCVIEIALYWDKERNMYRIDFRNNGNSLPEGLTKDSYGENRKYAGRTGGTGIGGYEVAENVKHYDGDYSISQDGGWVVVSIYLPKSKKYEQERV